jgi:hypothetical protein
MVLKWTMGHRRRNRVSKEIIDQPAVVRDKRWALPRGNLRKG